MCTPVWQERNCLIELYSQTACVLVIPIDTTQEIGYWQRLKLLSAQFRVPPPMVTNSDFSDTWTRNMEPAHETMTKVSTRIATPKAVQNLLLYKILWGRRREQSVETHSFHSNLAYKHANLRENSSKITENYVTERVEILWMNTVTLVRLIYRVWQRAPPTHNA